MNDTMQDERTEHAGVLSLADLESVTGGGGASLAITSTTIDDIELCPRPFKWPKPKGPQFVVDLAAL